MRRGFHFKRTRARVLCSTKRSRVLNIQWTPQSHPENPGSRAVVAQANFSRERKDSAIRPRLTNNIDKLFLISSLALVEWVYVRCFRPATDQSGSVNFTSHVPLFGTFLGTALVLGRIVRHVHHRSRKTPGLPRGLNLPLRKLNLCLANNNITRLLWDPLGAWSLLFE